MCLCLQLLGGVSTSVTVVYKALSALWVMLTLWKGLWLLSTPGPSPGISVNI